MLKEMGCKKDINHMDPRVKSITVNCLTRAKLHQMTASSIYAVLIIYVPVAVSEMGAGQIWPAVE